jgi:hypothetical protein
MDRSISFYLNVATKVVNIPMGGRHYVLRKVKFLKIYCFLLSNGDYSILGSAVVDISQANQI